ncbi:phage portal protein [Amaricoccus solimangrovi]|uniref:Phage portal protein n=1 Tax=Amaricoccus solimangrovi TaxID=2589815 RepID=A0A501WYI8_9RHOB|nr:phage portal protein [Amaricoccus solimangrovi]TPE52597.1 phage portal protein [Amaricoccus solimangrovi]
MTSKREWWRLGRAAPSLAPMTRTPPALTAEAPEPVAAPAARAFKAARPGRLTSGFFAGVGVSSRDETRRDLRGLLAHARYAAQNIDYVRSYEMMVRRHVIGRAGIALQMDVRDPGGANDRVANDRIESAWTRWGRRGSVTPCGRLSWWNIENIAATMVAREGNCLLRVHRGPGFGPFGFQVAPISFDLLDLDHSEDLRDGRFVRGGIECDGFGRPLAYHLWTAHPSEAQGIGRRRRVRVAAEDIVHVWRPNEAGQEFGVPQSHTALRRFNMLARYEESALAAAHYGAAVAAFFKQEADDSPIGAPDAAEIPDEITPGMTAMLPPGVDIANWSPNYPDGEMPAFNKAMLRGGAAGLGVSYAGLTSDMEGANFSSLRDGRGEERDEWRMFQRDVAETLHAEVFRRWLPFGLAAAGLPLVKIDKFDAALWRPRSWPSVNPKDDAAANEADLRNGLKAPSQIVAERGEDFEGMVRRLAADIAMLREAGVPIPAVLTGAAGSSAAPADPAEPITPPEE